MTNLATPCHKRLELSHTTFYTACVLSQVYGKFGKKLVSVVKQGGPDPSANSALNDLLKQAKDLGVPRDIIDRNLKKASEAKQADFSEVGLGNWLL